MIAMILVGILLAVASYFGWCYIHEMSHILMAKATVGIYTYVLRIFPHKYPGVGWRWAACQYVFKTQPTSKQRAAISLAPRIPDTIALIMFALTGLFTGWAALIWGICWGAGVIDTITGSLGISEHSDLRVAATRLDKNPWWFRVAGFVGIAASLAVAAITFFGG